MSKSPASRMSQPDPMEIIFAPHQVSSLCQTWLSEIETDDLCASTASCRSPVVVPMNESDSALDFLSTPSKRHHDLGELPSTGSFARSNPAIHMHHSLNPPHPPIVVQLPNGTPKEPKTATLVSNRYDNARSASVGSTSLASTTAESTKTVLKFTRSSSAASNRSQTLMFDLGFSQLNLVDPDASRWVDQAIGDGCSSTTPPVSSELTRDTSLQSRSMWFTQHSTFMDPYSTACRLRGGGGPNHQRTPNSTQNTPQSAYGSRSCTPHSSRSSDTSLPLSSSGSSIYFGSIKAVKQSANLIHASRQRAIHVLAEPKKLEQDYHNINRQKDRTPKPKATTRQSNGYSQKDAGADMEGSTTFYTGSPIPRRQSEAVQSPPSDCISSSSYLSRHRYDRKSLIETDHGANTQAHNIAVLSLPRNHRIPVCSVSRPRPVPFAKPNLHTVIKSYLSVLESIVEALDVHLQDSQPSPSLRGGCCTYCCGCSVEGDEPPSDKKPPKSNDRTPPYNNRGPNFDNREQPSENPTSTPPRDRTMDRQERLFRKSYAETDAMELHKFKQGQFQKPVGGSKGLGKKVSNTTDTAVSDSSGSKATDSAVADNLTSSSSGANGSIFEPTSSTTNPRGSIFGPFSMTSPDSSILVSTRTPLAWEDPIPSWSFSQMVPHPQDRPRLRGGGVNEEAEEFEDYERGDAAYPRRTIPFEVMSCANSYPERMRSSSQGILPKTHFWVTRSSSDSQDKGEGEGNNLSKLFRTPLETGDVITSRTNINAMRTETYSKYYLGRKYADAADIQQIHKDIAQAFENRLTPDLTLTDPRVGAKLTAISVVWGCLRGGFGCDDEDGKDTKDDLRDVADKEEEDPKDTTGEAADKEDEIREELPPRSNSNMFHPAYYDRTPSMGPNPKPIVEKPRNVTNELASPPDTLPRQIQLPGGNWVFTYNSQTRTYEPTYVGPRPNVPQTQLMNDGPSQSTQDRERSNPETGSAQNTTPENPESTSGF